MVDNGLRLLDAVYVLVRIIERCCRVILFIITMLMVAMHLRLLAVICVSMEFKGCLRIVH